MMNLRFVRLMVAMVLMAAGAHAQTQTDGTVLVRAAYVRLAGEARKGHTALALTKQPMEWRAGDVVLIPDDVAAHGDTVTHGRAMTDSGEVRTIESVDGERVHLSSPLERDHMGLGDASNVATSERLPIVINLSRILVIRER